MSLSVKTCLGGGWRQLEAEKSSLLDLKVLEWNWDTVVIPNLLGWKESFISSSILKNEGYNFIISSYKIQHAYICA